MIPQGRTYVCALLGECAARSDTQVRPYTPTPTNTLFEFVPFRAYINASNRIEFVHGNFFLLLSPQRAKIHDTAAHSAQASVRIRLTMLAFTGGQSCRSTILSARFSLAKYEFVNCLTRVSAGLSFADQASANWGIHILI